jgi:uncharacterized membrane protein
MNESERQLAEIDKIFKTHVAINTILLLVGATAIIAIGFAVGQISGFVTVGIFAVAMIANMYIGTRRFDKL